MPQPAGGGDAAIKDPGNDLLSGPQDWPGVEWPTEPIGKNSAQTGTGNWGTFTVIGLQWAPAVSAPVAFRVPTHRLMATTAQVTRRVARYSSTALQLASDLGLSCRTHRMHPVQGLVKAVATLETSSLIE